MTSSADSGRGHLGFQGGVAYVDATGTLRSETFGFTETETQSFPFPPAGAEFRALPLGSPLVQIGGGLKGMSLGDCGHYLDASLDAGIGIGRAAFQRPGVLSAIPQLSGHNVHVVPPGEARP